MEIIDNNHNGYRCDACKHLFPVVAVIERDIEVLEDSMYGRPPQAVRKVELCCPNCDGTELTEVALCTDCHEALAMVGGDFCLRCDSAIEQDDLFINFLADLARAEA